MGFHSGGFSRLLSHAHQPALKHYQRWLLAAPRISQGPNPSEHIGRCPRCHHGHQQFKLRQYYLCWYCRNATFLTTQALGYEHSRTSHDLAVCSRTARTIQTTLSSRAPRLTACLAHVTTHHAPSSTSARAQREEKVDHRPIHCQTKLRRQYDRPLSTACDATRDWFPEALQAL